MGELHSLLVSIAWEDIFFKQTRKNFLKKGEPYPVVLKQSLFAYLIIIGK